MFTQIHISPLSKMLWSPLLCYILTISESIFHHSDNVDDIEDDEVDDDDTENILKYLWSSPKLALARRIWFMQKVGIVSVSRINREIDVRVSHSLSLSVSHSLAISIYPSFSSSIRFPIGFYVHAHLMDCFCYAVCVCCFNWCYSIFSLSLSLSIVFILRIKLIQSTAEYKWVIDLRCRCRVCLPIKQTLHCISNSCTNIWSHTNKRARSHTRNIRN